jgi:hypothetical protein
MHWRDLWSRPFRDEAALATWHLLRPSALALATVLAARLAGRRGSPLLASGAAGLGLVVGWFALFGLPPSAHALLAGHAVAERARLLAVAALAAALLTGSASASETLVAALLAGGIGWWMADAPATQAALLLHAPALLAGGAFAWLLLRMVSAPPGAAHALAASAVLAAALAVAGAPPPALVLALVPMACAIGLLGGAATSAALLPVAAGVAVAGLAIADADGRLARGSFGAIDAACLAPLVTAWTCGRLRGLPRLLGEALAAAGGLAFAVLLPRMIAWF